ncbi:MAG: rRNA maturation RNase YbeY [Candidatus Hydrogenedentes bacterium]|nr:rRNA maturation RNase YbeY [Candidatus Hydrogenedentota bacterium]
MIAYLETRNESTLVKRLVRQGILLALAQRVCEDEGMVADAEISVLFCDDAVMQELNKHHRGEDRSTDVLAFPQDDMIVGGRTLLGDIVISLEMVAHRCDNNRAVMRQEVKLLFCHGLLHLLGYDHDTAEGQAEMAGKQAGYLGISSEAAWPVLHAE